MKCAMHNAQCAMKGENMKTAKELNPLTEKAHKLTDEELSLVSGGNKADYGYDAPPPDRGDGSDDSRNPFDNDKEDNARTSTEDIPLFG